MKTGKQVLCFLLALALVFGLLPTTVQPVQAAEAAQPAANPVVKFQFSIAGAGTIVVDGEDRGTSVDVEAGSDLTFRVKSPGYQINVVLLDGRQPLTADSNGAYTISNVTESKNVTIMVTQKDNVELSFEAVGAKVTISGTDYTDRAYSARYNEEVTFAVETDSIGATVTVETDNCTVTDNGDGTYTTSEISSTAKVRVTAEGGEARIYHTVKFQFPAPGTSSGWGEGSVIVNGVDCGTSVSVESGKDLVFRIKAPGYKINAVLLNGTQPISVASDGSYTLTNVTKDCNVVVMLAYVSNLSLTFDAIGTKVTVDGTDYSGKVYSAQYNEEVTFRVEPENSGASVTVTADKCTITDNGDGTYTTSALTADTTVTAQAEGAVKESYDVTFRCTDAEVTVSGEDYTEKAYEHFGGPLTFVVKIPEGYYVKAVNVSPDSEIMNFSELRDGKVSYYMPEVYEDLIITIVAEEGQENTWPLEYRYSYQGPILGTRAILSSCAADYEGTLEIDAVTHNGVLIPVSGIGEYAFAQCYKLTEVTIGDTVQSIGNGAFCFTGLRHIQLPENLRSIGRSCFYLCQDLEEITIPTSVTVLQGWSFGGCHKLRSVTLPDGLKSIGEYAFLNCTALKELTLPDSVSSIEKYAFQNCSALEEITVPAGVTVIESYVFSACESLKRVTFLGAVTSIEDRAFYKAKSLESIDLPDSLTNLGSYSFAYCGDETNPGSGLREIVIPAGFEEISEGAFYGCKNLRSVIFQGEVTEIQASAFKDTGLESIDLPDSLVTIGQEAFRGTALTEIRIPKDCTSIGKWAFHESTVLQFQTDPENQTFMAGDDGVLFSRDGKQLVLYPYGRPGETYTVPAGVELIGDYAFYANPNLEQVTFPESLRDFGDDAFFGLPQLSSLALPEGLEDITGQNVFWGCAGLTELKLPSSLKDISGVGVFGSIGITELTLPEGMEDITGTDVFRLCEHLNKVTFPKKMKKISGGSLFAYCYALTEVTFPEALEEISGNLIFSDCGLTSLMLPASLRKISGSGTFAGCKFMEAILPENLEVLGGGTFRGCTALQQVVLPEGITILHDETFDACESLEEIRIPEGVKEIGAYCFFDCKNLKEITLPDSLERIYSFAFALTKIQSLSLPASVKELGQYVIGLTLDENGALALDKENTYVLYFAGDFPQWEAMYESLPNLSNIYCYFPRNNSSWRENLRYLDSSGFYMINWVATSISLPESLELTDGCRQQVTAAVQPEGDPHLALIWSSSDESVVQVDENGVLTGIAPGTATITASAGGGAYTARCQVTVLEDSKPVFRDVPEDAWYYEAVRYTSEHGLFRGITETEFGPNRTMTRGMLVTVLYRLEGEPSVEGQTHPFTDVSTNRYYSDAIAWAAGSGVVNGVTETLFAPEAPVTREQMVTILYRYANLKGADVTASGDLSGFPDGDQVKNYAREAFRWAVGAGIIEGSYNGGVTTLSPRSSATRAQVAAVLMRYLQGVV